MKINRFIKFICLLSIFINITSYVLAGDYYVHPGTANGSGTEDNPANITQLRSYLASYDVRTDSTLLNLYFKSGTYSVPSGGLTFHSTTSYTSNLEVHFMPWEEDGEVIFTGAGSGSSAGDVKFLSTVASTYMTVTLEGIKIKNFKSNTGTSETGGNSLFTVYGNTTLKLQNVEIDDISSLRTPLLAIGINAFFIVDNSIISNITKSGANSYAVFETCTDYSSLIFTNSILDRWKVSSNSTSEYSHMFWLENTGASLTLTNTTISNCEVKNHLFRYSLPTNSFAIENCTFSNNSIGSGYLIYTGAAGSLTLCNNTFSSNTVPSDVLRINIANSIVLNNTFYNSGRVFVTNSNAVVRNNLAFGTSTIRGENSASRNAIVNNITDNTHFSGVLPEPVVSGGIPNFSSYISSTLEPQVTELGNTATYPLLNVSDKDHPILRKGIIGDYASLLYADQRGKKRPAEISIGAWDLPTYDVVNGTYTILYDPEVGFESSYPIDLSNYVTGYPDGISLEETNFEIISMPLNGSLTLNNSNNDYEYDFIPKKDEDDEMLPARGIIDVPYEMIFKVYNDIENDPDLLLFEQIVKLKIVIINIKNPMGIIDESILRCYTYMGQVSFEAEYKFESGSVNPQKHRYDGFTIPLVGDLNGDGKPEIVVMGIGDNTGASLYGKATYIYILNGQTGEEIVKYPLPTTWAIRDPTHNTPSWMALVDSDRNGRAEIIVAFGLASDQKYRNRVVSYEVNSETFSTTGDITNKNRLTEKWISDVRFDQATNGVSSSMHYRSVPLPQVVDIDGDGNPEILVYNKIYDAQTGKLKITLEDLEPTSTWVSITRTINQYRDYAYIGRNRYTTYGAYDSDKNINFSYVYDLDGDGRMEVIAGGKVYYNLDPETGHWEVKSADASNFNLQIGDGYTAVADINSDGKAEIVVVSFPNGSSQTNLRIVVWDPKFVVEDGNGGWMKNPNLATDPPVKLADMTVPFSYHERQGTHSYVYIGDIDGLTQTVNGVEKKYPEISILGSRFYYNTTIPWHPSVKEKFSVPTQSAYDGNSSGIARGALMSWTWDEHATGLSDRLKVSFLLEHNDRSLNTGFTLFDFDNDGIQDICYRDEKTLRIVSASKPFVKLDDTSQEVMRFKEVVKSFTGYEYPVIADIDGDGSADMIVMGSPYTDDARGYIYAVHAKVGTEKFAPAPRVWNQFMYHPLRINEDLSTPRVNLHPLSPELAYLKGEDYNKGRNIKTHIYNNTLTQVVKSALFEMPALPPDEGTVEVLIPIVPIADAVLLHGKIDTNAKKLQFYVKNIGNATLVANTPIRIFKEDASGNTNIPGGLYKSLTVGKDVFEGDSVLVSIDLPETDLHYTYTIRVTDPSTSSQDLFMADPNYVDCNWADNVIEVGDFVLRYDAETLLQYTTIDIDVLANDSLPIGAQRILTEDMIRPLSTGDIGTWRVVNNRLRYTAPESYPGGVVEFEYTITHGTASKTTNVYIYILESCMHGFSVCTGSEYYVCLEKNPEEILFDWYNEEKSYIGTDAPVIRDMQGDRIYYAKPNFKDVTDPEYIKYRAINFPLGKVIIKLLPIDGSKVTARWRGYIDNSWYNSSNWVQIKENGNEMPVTWTPTGCVDVIISKDAEHYPQLNIPTICGDIMVEDRAMISGIHLLEYDNAEVEFTFTNQERSRFVMWSAPLKSVYTGDYHFKNTQGEPKWGDVFMNFFQSGNPDVPGSVATENMFTATFGNLETPLSLGKPFTVKVTNLDETTTFKFPQEFNRYQYDNGSQTSLLNRDNGTRFIIDADQLKGDGYFHIPVEGNNNFKVIHMVNPFMAYLNVGEFLELNKNVLEQTYKIWDGNVDGDFVSIQPGSSSGRYALADDPGYFESTNLDATLIAPLQSFFVMKKDNTLQVSELRISPDMTTVDGGEFNYALKASGTKEQKNVLYIRATQEGSSGTTVIFNDENASREYNPAEDAYKLFKEGSIISVYTITDLNEPLAINATGDFSGEIKLGVRATKEGSVTLNFTHMDTFGYKVYLKDKSMDNKMIDLSKTPSYTFKIASANLEVNDRFLLYFEPSPDSTGDNHETNELIAWTEEGKIYLQSLNENIEEVEVVNIVGSIIYKNKVYTDYHEILVPSKQIYIVKVKTGTNENILKVAVK